MRQRGVHVQHAVHVDRVERHTASEAVRVGAIGSSRDQDGVLVHNRELGGEIVPSDDALGVGRSGAQVEHKLGIRAQHKRALVVVSEIVWLAQMPIRDDVLERCDQRRERIAGIAGRRVSSLGRTDMRRVGPTVLLVESGEGVDRRDERGGGHRRGKRDGAVLIIRVESHELKDARLARRKRLGGPGPTTKIQLGLGVLRAVTKVMNIGELGGADAIVLESLDEVLELLDLNRRRRVNRCKYFQRPVLQKQALNAERTGDVVHSGTRQDVTLRSRCHGDVDGSSAEVRTAQHCESATRHEVVCTGMLFGHQSGLQESPLRETKAGDSACEEGAARVWVLPLEGKGGVGNGGRSGHSGGGRHH